MAIAIDCFAHYGYQGTSIERIASAAGVTKGALYYHFRDKEELLFAAVQDRIAEFEQHVVGSVTPEADPAGALAEIARVCAHIAIRNNLRRFILTLMVEALDTNPRLSEAFRGILRRFRGYLAGIVRVGQGQGVFRRDVDAALAAQLFAGGVVGAELQHYQDPERVDLAAAMEGVAAQLLAFLTSTAMPAAVAKKRVSSRRGTSRLTPKER
ncbi:MAG: TetR/AcrR family transcriptional regulator [Myxococcales bacterium]|jgi:AcrR family transcriptional regulator|nr:TetR/AcrR family transcriptional regulator [Myxococcales bacterium]